MDEFNILFLDRKFVGCLKDLSSLTVSQLKNILNTF